MLLFVRPHLRPLTSPHHQQQGIDSPILPSRFDSLNPSELAGIRERLEEYSAEFRALAVSLVAQLGQAPDLDMRFLAVRLNFNYHFSKSLGLAYSFWAKETKERRADLRSFSQSIRAARQSRRRRIQVIISMDL